MLISLTLLASTDFPQIGGIAYPLTASTAYLFNGNRIKTAKTYSAADTEFEYVFEPDSRHSSYAVFRVDGEVTALAASIETGYTSQFIALSVVEDYDGEEVTETRYVNAADVILCDAFDTTTPKTAVFVSMGGVSVKRYVVSQTLAEIVTLCTS